VKLRFCRRWKYGYLFALLLTVLAAGCGGDLSSGDRVLVAKFLYDTGLKEPRRFDVVVFRFPERPIENGTPKNYIKRLLGLPGELLALFFGNIYRYNAEEYGPVGHPLPNVDPKNLWRSKESAKSFPDGDQFGMIENHARDRKLFEAGKFTILRKSPATLLAMRRIVYDNDHQPKDKANDPDFTRWLPKGGSDWKVIDQTGLACGGKIPEGKDPGFDWIHYRHIPRNSRDAKRQLITDFLGYNAITKRPPLPPGDKTPPPEPKPYDPNDHNWVGDLILECELTVKEARGEFCMELSEGQDRFQACWDLATGECTLYRLAGGQRKKLGSKKTRVSAPGTYEVRFANVDDRLTVWVGRDLPFEEGVTYGRPRDQHGPSENDLEPASLGSKGAAVEVRHLRLWRDVYYTLEADKSVDERPLDERGNVPSVDFTNPETWKPLRGLNFKTIYVQPRHYFCMGDNSAASSDSRQWGLVPERLMLGRALLVYFPFNRAGVIE
jgi:signal peptidase I